MFFVNLAQIHNTTEHLSRWNKLQKTLRMHEGNFKQITPFEEITFILSRQVTDRRNMYKYTLNM